MNPGTSTSPAKETATLEPGSKLVPKADQTPESEQTPRTPPQPQPENTAKPRTKTQQESSTPQEPPSQQRLSTQQEALAQPEAKPQQQPGPQPKATVPQQGPAASQESTQQSSPIQKPSLMPQEATSWQGLSPRKESTTPQKSESREDHVIKAVFEAVESPVVQHSKRASTKGPPAQAEPASQDRSQLPESLARQTTPGQGANSRRESLTENQFPMRNPQETTTTLQEISTQPPPQEWKTFLEWALDSDSESEAGYSDTDILGVRGEAGVQEDMPIFKEKFSQEGLSGHGRLFYRKKANLPSHRHYRDTASRLVHSMDLRTMTQSLVTVAEDNMAFFSSQGPGETARRLSAVFAGVREQALGLEPALARLLSVAHIFDLDAETPANGFRSLVHTARCCLAHLLHKSRYVASNRRSIFFRTGHNLAELEAYLAALTQLRALAYYAQRLLATNQPGGLFFEGDERLTADFLSEYVTLHKGCFYGRCLGFQFTPAIRPFLQTISIGLVSFGEHYKRNETGLGVTASSLFTSGRFAIDPELRGAEFERIIQNLDVHFWKAFWNITEIEVLSSLANMASANVRVSRLISLPPEPFNMPLTSDPKLTVTISPPSAHSGPGPVLVRLISYDLREGQDSEELNNLVKSEGPRNLELRSRVQQAPRSRSLVVHIHGGGFVAQTSKSHEPYLKSWAQDLGVPILSIDYSLAPEAPFPRALEECFYAYCWAIKHCALLGSTGERICLAGDSAGGNLCFTVSLRAAAYGVRVPDGIMAAYPATLLQSAASPSRLLSLMDPLLPLTVLSKCVSAYAGGQMEEQPDSDQKALGMMGLMRRDTALLLKDLRMSASSWLNSFLELSGRKAQKSSAPVPEPMRRSVSDAALAQPEDPQGTDSLKNLTVKDLSLRSSSETSNSPEMSLSAEALGPSSPSDVNFFLRPEDGVHEAEAREEQGPKHREQGVRAAFPEGFHPRISSQGPTQMSFYSSPIVKNPFMSPLLAPDSMLRTLPPVHIVACALDPMLDDSVMFARRLRCLGQPVTLRVVEDLPHGFLSLAALCRETRQAAELCVERIRLVLGQPTAAAPTPASMPTAPPL